MTALAGIGVNHPIGAYGHKLSSPIPRRRAATSNRAAVSNEALVIEPEEPKHLAGLARFIELDVVGRAGRRGHGSRHVRGLCRGHRRRAARVGFRLSLTDQKLTSRLRNRATSDKSICSEPLIVRLVNLKTAYICSITLTGLTFSPALAQFAE